MIVCNATPMVADVISGMVPRPTDYDPTGPGHRDDGSGDAFRNPANFSGFAGLEPVYTAELDEGAGDLGGDRFDLAQVGIARARFVRIVDSGSAARAPGTETCDDRDDDPDDACGGAGDLVEDTGNVSPVTGDREGFDLDAVGALHIEGGR